jgi:hypothetical protein
VLLSTVLWLTYILSGEKRAFKKAFKPFWSTFRTALTDPVKGAQAGFEQARDVLRDLLKDPNDTEHPLPVALQDALWTAARPLRRVARREGKLQEFDAALTSAGSVALSVETLASLYPRPPPRACLRERPCATFRADCPEVHGPDDCVVNLFFTEDLNNVQ